MTYATTPQNQTVGEQSLEGLLGVLQTWMPGKFMGVPQPQPIQAASVTAGSSPSAAAAVASNQQWENA
eukprot:3065625-Karenia_brevis.AAC.1